MPRVIAYLLLIGAGIVSLPVAAYFLDGQGTENWILPAQLATMAVIGALVGQVTPALVGAGASARKRAALGALLGIGAAVVGVVLFFLLINGFSGA
ncbi:hypothetical protein F0U44_04605 [Nocardioides humilatus]|uniref:Major facilitator superfamily (MFS) profile domain-containing protein n=1 Tax=Nocardioides humilatus TaxID=2607660 RepID=A0A5B1LP70_9ACTN|nr:hypothetical protein [Nocardioides humilatus]KAA1421570.1 hypothetical protein F0U44_04605 [Nocardioides humilatus]